MSVDRFSLLKNAAQEKQGNWQVAARVADKPLDVVIPCKVGTVGFPEQTRQFPSSCL
jgi:hypothetical protein